MQFRYIIYTCEYGSSQCKILMSFFNLKDSIDYLNSWLRSTPLKNLRQYEFVLLQDLKTRENILVIPFDTIRK